MLYVRPDWKQNYLKKIVHENILFYCYYQTTSHLLLFIYNGMQK
jgi:hypothetical protein